MAMDYMKEIKDISAEEAIILWQASRLSLSKSYEKAPEILKVHGSVIGTLGNFQRIHRQSQSKKTFQCIGYRSRYIEEWHCVAVCGRALRRVSGKCFMLIRSKALIIA